MTNGDPVSPSTAAAILGPDVTSRYEVLRAAGLGLAVTPEQRSGLSVFLRGGMWAWACAVIRPVALSARTEPRRRAQRPGRVNVDPAVQLLASMAMNITQGVAQ